MKHTTQLQIIDAMQANEITPIEGYRLLKQMYRDMTDSDSQQDYICALYDLDTDLMALGYAPIN